MKCEAQNDLGLPASQNQLCEWNDLGFVYCCYCAVKENVILESDMLLSKKLFGSSLIRTTVNAEAIL